MDADQSDPLLVDSEPRIFDMTISGTAEPLSEGSAIVSNGLLSVPIGPDGLPSPAGVIRLSRALGHPATELPTAAVRPWLLLQGEPVDPKGVKQYRQVQDHRTGAVVTSISTSLGQSVQIRAEALPGAATLDFLLDFWSDAPGDIRVGASRDAPGQEPVPSRLSVKRGREDEEVVPEGVVTVPGSRGHVQVRLLYDLSGGARATGGTPGADALPRITIDGPDRDQAIINSLLWQALLLPGPGADGLSPFGLTNERYGRRVFWDADVWIFPALALLSPKAAEVPKFRLATAPMGEDPVKFPWEADERGVEQAKGDTARQEHVSGAVLLGLEMAAALGFADPREVKLIGYRIARHFLGISKPGPRGLEITGVMGADEWKIVNNDLYTNMLAERAVRRHVPSLSGVEFALPLDANGQFLTHDGDEVRAYQQASALLAVFPLQDPRAERQAKQMLDRFAGKIAPNGPAMSHSLHALIRVRFGGRDEALEEWRISWARYAVPPFNTISEVPAEPRTIFVTGAAGFLNTVLYGFAGLRLAETPWPDADWKVDLKNGWSLSGRPQLPTEWRALTIEPLLVQGKPYRLKVDHERSTLTAL